MGFISKLKSVFRKKQEEPKKGAILVGLPKAYEQKQKFQIDFLKHVGLLPTHSFIDIGCGVLRGGIPVIRFLNTGNYVGLDVNQEALQIAKEELKNQSLEDKAPHLIHVNKALIQLDIPFKADRIWAFSVLIHMTDEHVMDCLAFVSRNISPGGIFYANVNIGQSQDGAWREFPVKWRPLNWYETAAGKYGLQVKDLGSLESFGHKSVSDVREDQQHMLEFTLLNHAS
ncbi:MAG TPA: class I SAM-dependent methyltransferase [Ohtaekwangia sp.]